jgi:cystine transport system substrate-binding protein
MRAWLAILLLLLASRGLADDHYAAIQKSGHLRIGLEGTYPPFGYQDESGALVGFDVDIAKAVSERMGLKPEFVPSKWEGILAALESGRFDVVVNQVTLSDARRKVDIRTYEDDSTRNQDLLVGRIDAVLNDRLIVGSVLKLYGGRLVAAGAPLSQEQEAIAFRKGSPELVAALDQALASLSADGSLRRISEKWFQTDVTHP